MIVKYWDHGVWGFIDNVRQIAQRQIDVSKFIIEYDEQSKKGERDKIELEGCKTLGVELSNKAFLIAIESFDKIDDLTGNFHSENLLHEDLMEENLPASIILLYLNDHKEYDNVILVTNQGCYLMNDDGKTIERLV